MVRATLFATLLGFNIYELLQCWLLIHSFCCNKIEKCISLGHYVVTLRAVFTKFEISIPLNVLILFIYEINYIYRTKKYKLHIMVN